MKAIRTLLACIRKADSMFSLIQHGDKIVIGLSGGKDSIALTYCLHLYQKFSHTDFTIQPVTLNLGFPGFNSKPLEEFCTSLGLKLMVTDNTEVYKILQIQQERQDTKHLPCSICSRMKKAAINKIANEIGFNKVAFAHHADDAIETLMMNEIHGGRIATFSPSMHLENANIDFIRPLILARESDISKLIKEENLPVCSSCCPADKNTTREDIKEFLNSLYHKYPQSKEAFLDMLYNDEQLDLWGKEIAYQVDQDGLIIKPIFTPKDMFKCIDIRQRVFVREMNVDYDLEMMVEKEEGAHNFLIIKNSIPIGTIRYRFCEGAYKLERFALLKEYRHKGYAVSAINFLINMIKEKYTPCVISLHSEPEYINFYKRLGFVVVEDILEKGRPLTKMIKNV